MKTIQQILDEERKKSGITNKSNHEVAMAVVNHEKTLDEAIHRRKSDSMKERYKDPDYNNKHREIIKAVTQTDEWKQSHANGIIKRKENGWEEKNAVGAKKKCKTIQTPHGVFSSKGEAVKAMAALGIINASGKLSAWLNTKPDEYYYIDK